MLKNLFLTFLIISSFIYLNKAESEKKQSVEDLNEDNFE